MCASVAFAQNPPHPEPHLDSPRSELETTEDWNRRLQELWQSAGPVSLSAQSEYRIGPEELLEITVFGAPELNRVVRVSASGKISLMLLGTIHAAGFTPQELEVVLEEHLRRTYMKDPHVGVYVHEMQSHPVSVFGAVKQPGVFQIRGTKTLIEVLSLAQGLAEDAGDTVIVMRGTSFSLVSPPEESTAEAGRDRLSVTAASVESPVTSGPGESTEALSVEIDLKELLESGDPHHNVPIYPGDIVKVARARIVYVVGEVNKPGGFVLRNNENISLLQALALGEGLTSTAAKGRATILRTTDEGRTEIPVNLGKILKGKAPDPYLRPNDVLFVPNSATKTVLYEGFDAALRTITGVIIWRR